MELIVTETSCNDWIYGILKNNDEINKQIIRSIYHTLLILGA
jgi:hypothetical protein